MIIPNKNDFMSAIQEMKVESRMMKLEYIELLSYDLHKKLGHYPGSNHRMPTCCRAMYDLMDEKKGDCIIEKPEKGLGAKLKIRYYL